LQLHPAALQARNFIEAQPGHDWTIEELSRRCGVSASHLAHVFTREIGLSPRQFLLRARLERARALLESSDLGVTQIALECGFASGQHFATAFRRSTGLGARAYRQQVRSKSTVLCADAAIKFSESAHNPSVAR
jgi:AraC-like DNA-binding protein